MLVKRCFRSWSPGIRGVLWIAVMCAWFALAACRSPDAPAGDATRARAVQVIEDVSPSISAASKAQSRPIMEEAILAKLGPGSSLQIFVAHGESAAPPVFEIRIPPLPDEPTVRERIASRALVLNARAEARTAFATAPSKRIGSTTDLLGMLVRCRPHADIHLFTDGLHDHEVDLARELERAGGDAKALSALMTRLANRYRWTPRMLTGARFWFHLTPPDGRQPHHARTVMELRQFYRSVIGSLGGTVVFFDTGGDVAADTEVAQGGSP